jgi:capsular polysaccharide biosynthesis protein
LHLELFGYPEKSRTQLDLPGDSEILYRVPTLYYPSPTVYPSQMTERGLKYLRSKYYTLCDSDNPPEETKLYLHRPKLRTVKNDSEVIDFLKEHNFTILDGTEGIREHVRLFRNASIIIGPHGSMFRNIIFSDKNPKVFEFCPHNRPARHQLDIGKMMNLEYTWTETEADDDFSIRIDLDVLRDIIGA